MKRKMSERKDGFSLMELLIAISILTIFVGVVSLSIGLLRSVDTRGLASSINDSLTDLKSTTEAHKGPFYLHIYKNDSGFFSQFSDSPTFSAPTADDVRLGSASLDVNVSYNGVEDDEVPISDTTSCTILMQKKDGAYYAGTVTDESGTDTTLQVPRYFVIKNGTRADYKVYLAKETGLHYLEQL